MDKANENTAFFLKEVNDVFDSLNVRAFGSGAKPLTLSTAETHWMTRLREKILLWQVVSANGTSSRPPCFDGLVQVIDVALMLREQLVLAGRMKFLMTGRINQDCLENFFSQIRGKGGHRYNPSSKDFRYAYRSLCCRLLLTPVSSSNCEASNVPLLLSSVTVPAGSSHPHSTATVLGTSHSASTNTSSEVQSGSDFTVSAPVANVLHYLLGYVLSKLNYPDCSVCVAVLFSPDNSVISDEQLFVHFKAFTHRNSAFGKLTVPSEKLMHCAKLMHTIFEKNIRDLLGRVGVLAVLKSLMIDTVPFSSIGLCSDHQSQIITDLVSLFVRCRLHYFLRFETRLLLHRPQKNRKAKCVMHN